MLCSIFGNPFTVHKYNQVAIAIAVDPQMRPCTNHIAIKYHHFWSFVANGDVQIQYIDTKEQIPDIFMKPLDSELFLCLCYKLNYW